MKAATKRSFLRWIHLVATIPVLGYIYSPPAEVAPYVGGARYIFVPILLLSGYWMYAGLTFALVGLALWLATFQLAGFGPALLGQIILFIARKLWLVMRARRTSRGQPSCGGLGSHDIPFK